MPNVSNDRACKRVGGEKLRIEHANSHRARVAYYGVDGNNRVHARRLQRAKDKIRVIISRFFLSGVAELVNGATT